MDEILSAITQLDGAASDLERSKRALEDALSATDVPEAADELRAQLIDVEAQIGELMNSAKDLLDAYENGGGSAADLPAGKSIAIGSLIEQYR